MKTLFILASLLGLCSSACASHSPAIENTVQIEPVTPANGATALAIADSSIIFKDHNQNNILEANEGATITFKVINTSNKEATQCKASMKIEGSTQVDATDTELYTIKAGESKNATINLMVAPNAEDAVITATIMLEADGKANPAATLKMKLAAQETPARGRGK